MARYTGPKTKISRIFGEPILGNGKWLTKNSNPPGMHGAQRKRKTMGEYALQLREKQKAKYTYGVLEKQFRKTFEEAARRKLVLMVDHTFVYTGAVRKIREMVTSRALGDIYYYDSVRVNLGLFQRDVSVDVRLRPDA